MIGMTNPLTQFSLYPVQRTARSLSRGGIDDVDFDDSILPLTLNDGATIEDVSNLLLDDEFDFLEGHLNSYSIKELKRIKYAIVHRSPEYEENGSGGFILSHDLLKRSENIVAENAALLRLIRPTSQKTQMISGVIRRDRTFAIKHFNDPLTFTDAPENQKHFKVNTADLRDLVYYAPLFRAAMRGPNWKFRMAVQMHEAGHFQNTEWKARFFLWSAAVEALFTSKGTNWRQHSGSLVVCERVKDFLGSATNIYGLGEMAPGLPNPNMTIEDVIGDVYCLRNHIAHGDKVPDYYFELNGRSDVDGLLARVMVFMEAISFVIRKTLLKILKDGLITDFCDDASVEAYYTAKKLTKADIQARGIKTHKCSY